MLTRTHQGERLGACTDCRRYWARFRAGEIEQSEIDAVSADSPDRRYPHGDGNREHDGCIAEAMGISLPMAATIPAVHAESAARRSLGSCARAGPRRPSPTRSVGLGVQQCTGRAACDRRLDQCADPPHRHRCGRASKSISTLSMRWAAAFGLVDLKPSGLHYGTPARGGGRRGLRELRPLLHLDAPTISGKTSAK
jgi:dihydroxy-acid dehydratase